MPPTVNLNPCTYLRSSMPYVFASERAELAHINEQISSLDNHISQLNLLRNALHHRSRRIHNLLAPVHNLPVEILSYIFQQVVYSVGRDYPAELAYERYEQCLHHAFILSSISVHFRSVAFGTPKLWDQIPLFISEDTGFSKILSLLHHCSALAPNLNIAVFDTSPEREAASIIETLLTPDNLRKVRAFELSHSAWATDLWMKKLASSPPPLLNTLSLTHMEEDIVNVDFRCFNALTQLSLEGPWLDRPILVPSTVQYLHVTHAPLSTVVSLLYQCPNLIECLAVSDPDDNLDTSEDLDHGTLFTKPLFLNYLKRLSFRALNGPEKSLFAENLHLPSLGYLRFRHHEWSEFAGVLLLCRNTSATLTSLVIDLPYPTSDYAGLYELCKIPFPKLRKLKVNCGRWSPFPSIIRVLALLDSECNNTESHHLPSLVRITLWCGYEVKPRAFLDVLKKWKIGQVFHFRIECGSSGGQDEVPALQEELMSIMGRCRVEVTWNWSKVLQPLYGNGDSLIMAVAE